MLRDKGLRACLCVEVEAVVGDVSVDCDAAPGAGRTHKVLPLSPPDLGSRRMSSFTTSARGLGLLNTIISG